MQIIRDIKSVPVLRPLTGFIIGILAVDWFSISDYALLACMVVALVFLVSLQLFRIALKPGFSSLAGLMVFLIFFSSGLLAVKKLNQDQLLIPENDNPYWLGEALSDAVVKNDLARFEMSIFRKTSFQECYNTQVLMQVSNTTILPQAGQILILKTRPERIQGPTNPGEFDYAGYLGKRGFLYRCFIKDGEYKILNVRKTPNLMLISLRLRNRLWDKIESIDPLNPNLGVLYALGLGSKELLTPEIRETYAATGSMHVLAVSGLHVGLIWMALSYIFFWVRGLPGGKVMQFFLITGLIWFYALMTGATASVVRSAGMFSLVSFGKIIQKETSVYNSLAIAAFFGLLINPQWLTDAGFQLSYIAVLSIVFFQPRISKLFAPRNWLLRKIWDISSVSIAAQIGTLPLTIFYFNRFPPWFILSNLAVIPLVTIIMMVFIVLILFLLIPFAFSLVLKGLLFIIGVMNASVRLIEGLPSPEMDMIYLTDFQMFCFVISLCGITLYMRYRKNAFLFMGLFSFLFLISAGTFLRYHSLQQREIVLFSVPGEMIMGIVESDKGIFLHNSPDSIDIGTNFNYKCKPYLIRNGIIDRELTGLNDSLKLCSDFKKIPGKQNYYFIIGKKSILILDDPLFFNGLRSNKPLTSDIIIVNNRIPKLWKGQAPIFHTKLLVVSTAVSRYFRPDPKETGIIKADSIIDTRVTGAIRLPCLNETFNVRK